MLAEHYGVDWEWLSQAELRSLLHTSRYSDALFERQGFHFHPLKYVEGLARLAASTGVAVHEHSPAIDLERTGSQWRVRTAAGRWRPNRWSWPAEATSRDFA